MPKLKPLVILIFILPFASAYAGNVQILNAEFNNNSKGTWHIDVTLKHEDTGWQHYADNWRIVDSDGNILGDRVLHHPHVNEQPFTRSLSNVALSNRIKTVFVEAHDKKHGWTKNRLKINLNRAVNGYLKVIK